jgi:4-nitrophenyl phosphatase
LIDLSKKKLFMFDLDGVHLRGKEQPVKIGGTRVLSKIRDEGKKLVIVTNNSTDTVEQLQSRLRAQKILVSRDEILTSARLTAEYIAERYGRATYFLVGENGFATELDSVGLRRTYGGRADVVAVGLDRRLTYSKLDKAIKLAIGGAHVVGNHTARLYMSRTGPAMAVGPILKAIEYGSGRKGFAIGKPSGRMFEIAMRRFGSTKEESVMIGDQEDTDVEGARRAGIASILVRTGVFGGRGKTRADAILDNVDDLTELI